MRTYFFVLLGILGAIYIGVAIKLCRKRTKGFKVQDWILTIVTECGILTTMIIAMCYLGKVIALGVVSCVLMTFAIVGHSILLYTTIKETKANLPKQPIEANKK